MSAWLFQDHRQKEKLGERCPWSVGWVDPDGKRKSKRIGSKSMAEKHARKMEGQLAAGTYESASNASWESFVADYETKALAAMDTGSREATQNAINHFERIINPAKMRSITSRTFAEYVATRRTEPRCRPRKRKEGTKPRRKSASGTPISVATINKELRHLRAVVRKAARWGYLTKVPEIEFLKEPGKLPTYVTPEHFAKLYQQCDSARWPEGQTFTPGDWWRGLLMTAFMTGWRIGSLLALRWQDVGLEAGTALSRAADNKGKRDQLTPLHPIVVDHLRRLKSFGPLVFPWNHSHRALFLEFIDLQRQAQAKAIGPKGHYGFHDLRRAFATMNAGKLSPDALQALMQHKDYQTTQRYINMARQLNPAVAELYVPNVAAG
jgi:integrase